jgi:hypothetical protein
LKLACELLFVHIRFIDAQGQGNNIRRIFDTYLSSSLRFITITHEKKDEGVINSIISKKALISLGRLKQKQLPLILPQENGGEEGKEEEKESKKDLLEQLIEALSSLEGFKTLKEEIQQPQQRSKNAKVSVSSSEELLLPPISSDQLLFSHELMRTDGISSAIELTWTHLIISPIYGAGAVSAPKILIPVQDMLSLSVESDTAFMLHFYPIVPNQPLRQPERYVWKGRSLLHLLLSFDLSFYLSLFLFFLSLAF